MSTRNPPPSLSIRVLSLRQWILLHVEVRGDRSLSSRTTTKTHEKVVRLMDLAWYHWTGIVVVGVLQGFLNTVAGGGSLLVLPALTFLGMDLAVANGTNRIAILLQSASGAASFKRQGALSFGRALPLAAAATVGALVGTFIVVQVDKKMLNLVIAGLISLMALLLVFKPRMWEEVEERNWPRWAVYVVFFAVGIYGGFIQAGVGFFLSWALVVAAGMDLVSGNAVKTIIIGCYTTISLVIFFMNGLVNIPVGLVLAVGSMMGAVLGARFTVMKGNKWVRYVLAFVVVVSAVKMVFDAIG